MPLSVDAEFLEELVRFLGREVDQIALDLRADDDRLAGEVRASRSRGPSARTDSSSAVGEVGFLHVAGEDRRLVGEQEERLREIALLVRASARR